MPLVQELRRANPDVQISVQVRTEGDVTAIADLIESLESSLDGVSILTSEETVEIAEALVAELRPPAPVLPMPEATQNAPNPCRRFAHSQPEPIASKSADADPGAVGAARDDGEERLPRRGSRGALALMGIVGWRCLHPFGSTPCRTTAGARQS